MDRNKVIISILVVLVFGGVGYLLYKNSYFDTIINPGADTPVVVKPGLDDATREATEFQVYTIKQGDTLDSISTKFSISKDSIKAFNNLNTEELTVGNQINIPAADGILIVIEQGDTLESIASKYNIDKQIIADFNWLDYPYTLNPGNTLFIPDAK